MALQPSNVEVALTGAVSVGPTSTTAPTGTDSALTGVDDLGIISEDGVTETRDRTTESISGWQNGMTVRDVVTEGTHTYAFTMIETKAATVELYYGTEVDATATEGTYDIVPTATGGRKAFVLDVIDGDELERVWIPSGEVTEVGEKVRTNSGATGYPVTVTAYPDASLDGASARVWATRLRTPA